MKFRALVGLRVALVCSWLLLAATPAVPGAPAMAGSAASMGEAENLLSPRETVVDSDILVDTTWTYAESPYLVKFASSGLKVAEGATLTVEPGVLVRFEQYASLFVYGTLRAIGTSSLPIKFTGTSYVPGHWLGLTIQGQDLWNRNSGSVLKHVIIEYAETNLSLMAATAHVSHCGLRYASGAGLMAAFAGGAVIESSQIVGNGGYGLENIVGGLILAANNWWGDASGPGYQECNPGGTGDEIAPGLSAGVAFSPFLLSPNQEPAPVTAVDAEAVSIAPQRWFAPADGVTRIWVRVTLRDGNGLPLPGRTVHLTSDLGSAVSGGVTDSKGETLAYVVSGTPGDATLSATVADSSGCDFVRSPSATVTFTSYGDDALLPGAAAPYMNGRLELDPLPLIQGVPATVSARLTNPHDYPIEVNATFAYANIGLGLAFGEIAQVQNQRIEAHSDRIISVPWTPPVSGGCCIRFDYAAQPAGRSAAGPRSSGWAQSNLLIQAGPFGSEGTGDSSPFDDPQSEKDMLRKARRATGAISDAQLALDAVTSPSNVVGLSIPNLLFSYILDFVLDVWEQVTDALGGDPPRLDYRTIATLEELSFVPLQPGPDLSPARADAANALMRTSLDLTARLRAATLSLDRYGGAAAAGDLFWASQQASALIHYKRESGTAMIQVAGAIDTFLQVLHDEGVEELTLLPETVESYQQRLLVEGWSAEELEAAQTIGLSTAEIESLRQDRLAADPAEVAGSLLPRLEALSGALRLLGAVLQKSDNFPVLDGRERAAAAEAVNLVRIYSAAFHLEVGNPLTYTADLELLARPIDLPPDWMVTVDPPAVTLAPQEVMPVTVLVRPGTASVQATRPRLAVEGYAGGQLLGGVTLEVMVPDWVQFGNASWVYLPLLLRGYAP
jgi:hypothetical protein